VNSNLMKYYFRKAKTLPPSVVIRKAFCKVENKVLNTIDKVVANIFGTKMTDAEFLRKAWSPKCKFENLEELQKHFRERKEPKFCIDASKQEDIVSLIYRHFSNAPDKIIVEADKICEHIFDLLGSGPVRVYYGMRAKGFEGHCYNMEINSDKTHSSSLIAQKKALSAMSHEPSAISYEPIDWHIGFKSGYRWNSKTYYKNIKYGHRPGVDVKVPWELSRFQHLTTLGGAYFLSKNEKYVKEFVNQVTDWIEHNPPKFGVNWTCTMDVAIRVCNWLLAWEFFRGSPLINSQFIIKFFKSLLQHGRHIKNNLEYSETLTSNHYLSDIVGLVYLGVLIPEFKESEKWKNFGIKELEKEMKKQVYSDGVDFEASTCYHRLVLELFFYATFLVIVNDKNFKEVLDMRYLLTLGAIFFREPKFKIKEFGFSEEASWVFGKKGYEIWQNLEENCLANIGSEAFPDAGWYIMRNDKDYMIISCGPNGQNGNGGHCHNDKLSFELCVDGEDVIVDPGTYVYTPEPEWRNKFRSTTYHNTVVVDKKEQNEFNRKSLFKVKNDAEVKYLKWETGNEIDIFVGEHYGYKRFSQPVIHKREIQFYKKERKLEIIDKFTGEGKHNLEWNLILSPEFKQKLNISSDKLQWRKDSTFYSPEYGTITKTEKLTSILRVTIPVEVKFWIEI